MPISHKENIENLLHLGVWEITETELELRKGLALSSKALTRLSQRKSEVHRKGYLAIRQLLKFFEIEPQIHQYDLQGAPYLTDGRHLSITHTKNVAAIALSSSPVGVDLEHYQEKIKKIAPRFLHEKETVEGAKQFDIQYLTQIWTAKEALYKAHRIAGIHFNKQLLIEPFEATSKEGKGRIFHNEKTWEYELVFRYFHDYCLTVARPKIKQ